VEAVMSDGLNHANFKCNRGEITVTDRAVGLEQALLAVIGAYRNFGGDVDSLMREAQGLIIGNGTYRIVEHSHIALACTEIENAVSFKRRN
jgi:hypothetical protein